MAQKKKNNVLDKKVKVEGHKFTIKQLLIIVLIIALVGAGFCTYCYFKPFVDMYLLGDNEITVRKGEDYEEPGWVFTYNFREVDSENVNVSYKDIYNVELEEVNTDVVGTYVITYDFNYKKASKKLQRYVKVVAPDLDISLKGGNSINVPLNGSYTNEGITLLVNDKEVIPDAVEVKIEDALGNEVSSIDTTVEGTYTITYTVTYGTYTATATQYVVVAVPHLDLILNGGNVINISKNGTYNELGCVLKVNGVEATPDSLTITFKDSADNTLAAIDTSVPGTYKVIYEATFATYKATVTREVIVEDVVETEELSIHFLELGNENTGDSVYIKAGKTDILIDAGSKYTSAETIKSYVDTYCTDGKLEYVIATHNHTDHVAGFAGNSSSSAKNFKGEVVGKTGLFYYYDIGTLIDFNYAEAKKTGGSPEQLLNKEQVSSDFGSSTLYGKYLRAREYAISQGTNYYTAGECFNSENGASRVYKLSENITLEILYNYYYFNSGTNQNDYSVCSMLTYGDKHFMFTGDLELDGEERMAAYYDGSTPEKTLPHVDLFKAGHHGSNTSSNECLLEKITPDIVCVCCCAGSIEYTVNRVNTFPTQLFIDRISKYTDKVYVTSAYDETAGTFVSLNGNIVVSYSGIEIKVKGSKNSTILKDSEWFSGTVYEKSDGTIGSGLTYYTAETEGITAVPRRVWPTTA